MISVSATTSSVIMFLLDHSILFLIERRSIYFRNTSSRSRLILHKVILVSHNFKIEDRRRKVATLLAQSMTETEIAQELKVDQSTISGTNMVL